MSIQYNIWGIDDTGYKQSIAGNVEPTTLTALQESFSDKHRTFALDFSSANPNKDYFYSMEKRSNRILYTIYRTNWYRGPRLSYDAVTIISSVSIENPISALKALMNAYVAKKDKGIKNINLDSLLSTIKPAANEAPFRSVVKNGYIKYTTESELLNVFKNHRDAVKNFNKIYFFTSLPYLETGLGKISNIADYKPIAVMVLNYNSAYHKIKVEGASVFPSSDTLEVYPGDKIEVYTGNSNSPAVFTASTTLKPISLKSKPIPPRPKSGYERGKKGNQKDKKMKTLVLILCGVLLLLIGGMSYANEILSLFSGVKEKKEISAADVVEFKGGVFTTTQGDTITSANNLFPHFKKGGFKIVKDNMTYTYTLKGDAAIIVKRDSEKDKKVDIEGLEQLLEAIKTSTDTKVITKVVDAIQKVIKYKKITSTIGLEGEHNFWRLKKSTELEKKKKEETKFKAYPMPVLDLELKKFLKKSLPKSIFEKIKEKYPSKQAEVLEKEVNKENKIIKGCTDKNADNYNPEADIDDGSCDKENNFDQGAPAECSIVKKDKYNWSREYRRIESQLSLGEKSHPVLFFEIKRDACKKCNCAKCKKDLKKIKDIIETFFE